MKILVISDSHRAGSRVDSIVSRHTDINHIFFLGDNVGDVEDLVYEYPEKRFYIVSGNCDFFSTIPAVNIEKICGVNILYTHGHLHNVKDGHSTLLAAAKNADCKIALYGHTHVSDITYKEGIILMNPGSCAKSRGGPNSYGIIEITEKGIMPTIITL